MKCLYGGIVLDYLVICAISTVFLTATSVRWPSKDPCYFWPNAAYVNGKCYKLMQEIKTWQDAQAHCEQEADGGTLAELSTQEEKTAVEGLFNHVRAYEIWVGANDTEKEGEFRWTTTKNVLDTNGPWWSQGQPDNSNDEEDCVEMDTGALLDTKCASALPFVCQRPHKITLDPCYFWEKTAFVSGKCLGYFESPMAWQDAQDFCASFDGTLAGASSVTVKDEVVTLRSLAGDTGCSWLGASDRRTEGTFLWTSWQPVDDSGDWQSMNDSSGWQAIGHSNSDDNDCVCLGESSGQYEVSNCDLQASFVCEKEVPNPCDHIQDGAAYYRGMCYRFVQEQVTWDEARRECREPRWLAILAEPTSRDQHEFLLREAASVFAVTGHKTFWLAGINENGSWKWNWSGLKIKNQIFVNNLGKFSGAKLVLNGEGRNWIPVIPKQETHGYVCQREIGDPCEYVLPGGVRILSSCLKYLNTPMSWHDARKFCEEEDATLAEPATQEKSDALDLYLRSMGAETAWIGGTDEADEGDFRWFSKNQMFTYSALSGDAATEDQDYLIVNNASFWSQRAASELHPLLCEKEMASISHFRRIYVVFPNLQLSDEPEAYLQLSFHCESFGSAVQIFTKKGRDRGWEAITRYLRRPQALYHRLHPDIAMTSTGVLEGIVRIMSAYPLTHVVYISSKREVSSGSTLIVPRHILGQNKDRETSRSFFLVSGHLSGTQRVTGLAVSAQWGPVDGTVMLPASPGGHVITTDGFTFSDVSNVTFTIDNIEKCAYLPLSVDLDGAYLRTTTRVALFLGAAAMNDSGAQTDLTLDNLLPIQLLDRQYVTFPSFPIGVDDFEYFKLVAVENNTLIEAVSGAGKNTDVSLMLAGEVHTLELRATGMFYLLRGNASFYAFKMVERHEGGTPPSVSSCVTSLFPYNLWRHDYVFDVTSRLDGYDVYIAVVVFRNLTSNLTVSYKNSMTPVCDEITGTDWSGCHYHLPKNYYAYYHIHLDNYQSRFGAYLFAIRPGSIMCHSLGIANDPGETTVFDHETFMETYRKSQISPDESCQEITTLSILTTDAINQTTATSDSVTTSAGATTVASSTTTPKAITTVEFATSTSANVTPPLLATTSTGLSNTVITQQDTQALIKAIHTTLGIDPRSTSAYKRKKICISDNRPSAVTIGTTGIVFVSLAVTILVSGDVMAAVRKLWNKCKCKPT